MLGICGVRSDPLQARVIGPWADPDLRVGIVGEIPWSWRDAVWQAFDTWSKASSPLRFRLADDNLDIIVEWVTADHPDSSLVGPAIAHADFPPGWSIVTRKLPIPIHFDATEVNWCIGAKPGGLDVETVALHEIGHAIGVLHSGVRNPKAVMFPTVSDNYVLHELTPDDRLALKILYA